MKPKSLKDEQNCRQSLEYCIKGFYFFGIEQWRMKMIQKKNKKKTNKKSKRLTETDG